MSFVHFYAVGHFDALDPIAFGFPARPKPQRPVDPIAVNDVLKSLPHNLDPIVSVQKEGYVYCEWAPSRGRSIPMETVEQFVRQLADQIGGVVMNEMLLVTYPESARLQYQENIEELDRRWSEFDRAHKAARG